MATAKKITAPAPAKKAAKAPATAGIRPVKDTFTKSALINHLAEQSSVKPKAVKAVLAALEATVLGSYTGAIGIPQFLIQSGLFLAAHQLTSLATPTMLADFSACGGIIMLATGLLLGWLSWRLRPGRLPRGTTAAAKAPRAAQAAALPTAPDVSVSTSGA